MLQKAKYSIIQYCDELFEEDIEKIYSYIKEGVIVHLFLKGIFKDEIELNEYDFNDFKLAIDFNMLCIYENYKEIAEDNILIAIDGKIIEKEIYENICNDNMSEFNSQQYNIITSSANSNTIVVSGAGTGKTTTMINRLIYLRKTQRDFKFQDSVLITFTNKASREMRERLITILERYYKITKDPCYLDMMDEVSKCNISTIHGFAKSLINEFGKNININKNIEVKSFKYKRSNAITEALNRIYKEDKKIYEIIKNYPIYDIESIVMEVWNKLDNYSIDINAKDYNISFGYDDKGFSELLFKIISYAQENIDKEKKNEFEISDLIKKLSNKELYKKANGRYKIIMVDEFQDSDNIQIEFVVNFCKETGANILVVGDEKQSIYRFRGAEYTSFNKLKELLEYSNKTINEFSMIRNYRTNSNLLKQINRIFININNKVNCFSYDEKDYIYSLVDKENEVKIENVNLSETEYKKEFYSNILNSKGSNESIAVLLRSNNDIRDFKEFCDKYKIPCRIDQNGGFYRHQAVRDFYVMIKALAGSQNLGTLYSFIKTPYINQQIDKEFILKGTHEEKKEYIMSILYGENWDIYMKKVTEKAPITLIDKVILDFKPVRNYYEKSLRDAKRLQKKYKEIAYNEALEYKLNLEYLIYLIKDNFGDDTASIYEIENFLKIKIATDNSIDSRKLDEKSEKSFIQCLTVHKAKGLEYDYIIMDKLTKRFINENKSVDIILRTNHKKGIMIGFKIFLGKDEDEYKNNIYSNYLNDEKNEIVGEESRLLYVALTRCKKKLYLNMEYGIAATKLNTWKSLLGGTLEYV